VTGRLRIETADIASAEFLHKDLPYRSTDFEQIGLINTSPMILVARSVTEADAGVGSISNLACAVFHSVADVHPTVASYRGTPQATMDMLAGIVDSAAIRSSTSFNT
jgi:tripartite-type tricarboxylate transporter receptor subunit TctC